MSNLNLNGYHILPCYHSANGVPYSLNCFELQSKFREKKNNFTFYKGMAALISFGIAGIGLYALSKTKGLNIEVTTRKVISVGGNVSETKKKDNSLGAFDADKLFNPVKQAVEAADAAIKNINKAVQDACEKKANSNVAMPRCKDDRVFVQGNRKNLKSAPASQSFAMCV